MQRPETCLLSIQKSHQIAWAEKQLTAASQVHSSSVCLWAKDEDVWAEAETTNLYLSRTNRFPIQSREPAKAVAAKQGACALIPNPGLEPTFIAPHLPNNVSVLSKIQLSKQSWFYPQHSTQVHSSVLAVHGHTEFQYVTVSCTTAYLYSTCSFQITATETFPSVC